MVRKVIINDTPEDTINLGSCQIMGMSFKRSCSQPGFMDVTLTFSTPSPINMLSNEGMQDKGFDLDQLQKIVWDNKPGVYAIPRIYHLILIPKDGDKENES